MGKNRKIYITFCPKGVTEGSIIRDIFFKLGKIDSFLLNLAQSERTSEITAEEIGQKRFIFLESYPNHLHQQPSREKLQPQPHPQEEVANSTISPRGSRKLNRVPKKKSYKISRIPPRKIYNPTTFPHKIFSPKKLSKCIKKFFSVIFQIESQNGVAKESIAKKSRNKKSET